MVGINRHGADQTPEAGLTDMNSVFIVFGHGLL